MVRKKGRIAFFDVDASTTPVGALAGMRGINPFLSAINKAVSFFDGFVYGRNKTGFEQWFEKRQDSLIWRGFAAFQGVSRLSKASVYVIQVSFQACYLG